MKSSKQNRRIEALKRFTSLPYKDWLAREFPEDGDSTDAAKMYDGYLLRKVQEKKALELRVSRGR